MNVGKRLQMLRRAAGLTRRQLAARAGVAPSIVTMAEARVLVPDQPLLRRLYRALDPREQPLDAQVVVPVRQVLPATRIKRSVERPARPLAACLDDARRILGFDTVAAIERDCERREESALWHAVLRRIPFAGGLEAVFAMRLLLAGARLTRVRLNAHGFPWPVVDPRTGVFTGLSRRWALALDGRILLPAVTVQLPSVSCRLGYAGVARGGRFFAINVGEPTRLDVLPTLRVSAKALVAADLIAQIRSFAG